MAKYTAAREREIRDLLGKLDRSGASVSQFAREHGVSAWTVYGWRKRFQRVQPPVRRGGARPIDLVEVRTAGCAAACFELSVADVSIRVPGRFDEAELARLLRAVRSC